MRLDFFCSRLLVLGLLVVSGCAGSKETSQPKPQGLDHVNRALEEAPATIEWQSGKTSEALAFVRVTPDSVRFRQHTDPGSASRWERGAGRHVEETTRSRPIEEVRRITKEEPGGLAAGFLLGASPGLVLTGLGAFVSRDCSGSPCTLGAVVFVSGVGLSAAGGLIGGIVGGIAGGKRQVVYVAPVERYVEPE